MAARLCFMCGDQIAGLRKTCWDCGARHMTEGARAIGKVGHAVKRGQLRPATAYQCADCGAPAKQYDHRDYTEPLMVDPVCVPCNKQRGPAFNSFYREAA